MGPGTGILGGLQLLVVEDDHDAREIFRSVLTEFGATVTVTSSARESLRLLREVQFDAVVADILLGSSDGVALLTQARGEQNLAPFIAVSAADFESKRLEALGFAAYLRKPIDDRHLADTILAVLLAR